MQSTLIRCWKMQNPLYIKYHDEEWGTPIHNDQQLFELLTLEGFQAGLTWELILNRRETLKTAFADFNPKTISNFTSTDIEKVLNTPNIIRNKAKINSVINNAQKFQQIQTEFGSFNKFIWQFVNNKPINHALKTMQDMPCETNESYAMSKELKKRGFKFVGPIICYAYMQATGMVNDHLTFCFRYRQIQEQETNP